MLPCRVASQAPQLDRGRVPRSSSVVQVRIVRVRDGHEEGLASTRTAVVRDDQGTMRRLGERDGLGLLRRDRVARRLVEWPCKESRAGRIKASAIRSATLASPGSQDPAPSCLRTGRRERLRQEGRGGRRVRSARSLEATMAHGINDDRRRQGASRPCRASSRRAPSTRAATCSSRQRTSLASPSRIMVLRALAVLIGCHFSLIASPAPPGRRHHACRT